MRLSALATSLVCPSAAVCSAPLVGARVGGVVLKASVIPAARVTAPGAVWCSLVGTVVVAVPQDSNTKAMATAPHRWGLSLRLCWWSSASWPWYSISSTSVARGQRLPKEGRLQTMQRDTSSAFQWQWRGVQAVSDLPVPLRMQVFQHLLLLPVALSVQLALTVVLLRQA